MEEIITPTPFDRLDKLAYYIPTRYPNVAYDQ